MIFEPWYQNSATEETQILSSRVRLARNLSNFPFYKKLSEGDAITIVSTAEGVVGKINAQRPDDPLVAQDLRPMDQQILLEKHILSPKYLDTALYKGVFVDMHQNISVMVNEEDHIRIQAVCAGDNLPQALAAANKVDDLLEEYLDFAFDKNFGYLTAFPTNVGTGLRASYMMHLPCLERTNLLKKLFPYIIESGMTLRGIYGEGTISMGSIYQLSNQITLGKNETQIIKNLSAVAKNVMRRENQALGAIETKKPGYLQDRAYRAYGVLTNARTLSVKETMAYLSDIRLGFFANLLDLPKPSIPIYQIMMEIQPGHLHLAAGDILDERETDIARACYCRSVLRQDR